MRHMSLSWAFLNRDATLNNRQRVDADCAGILVVQERLNRIFGFCTIWKGVLLGYETVSAGIFNVACAARDKFTVFSLYPNSLLAQRQLLHDLLLLQRRRASRQIVSVPALIVERLPVTRTPFPRFDRVGAAPVSSRLANSSRLIPSVTTPARKYNITHISEMGGGDKTAGSNETCAWCLSVSFLASFRLLFSYSLRMLASYRR